MPDKFPSYSKSQIAFFWYEAFGNHYFSRMAIYQIVFSLFHFFPISWEYNGHQILWCYFNYFQIVYSSSNKCIEEMCFCEMNCFIPYLFWFIITNGSFKKKCNWTIISLFFHYLLKNYRYNKFIGLNFGSSCFHVDINMEWQLH